MVVIMEPGDINFKFLPWIDPKKYKDEKTTNEKPTKKIYLTKNNISEIIKIFFWINKSNKIEKEAATRIIITNIKPTKIA